MTMGPAPMIMIEAMSVRLGMVSLWREGASARCGAGYSGLGRERYSDPASKGKEARAPGLKILRRRRAERARASDAAPALRWSGPAPRGRLAASTP
jgi:hypothetical protein